MEDHKGADNNHKTSEDQTLSASQTENGKKQDKPNTQPRKSKNQGKKSFRRSWRAASPIQKLGLVITGIGTAVALCLLIVNIWKTLQDKWAVQIQHAPLVINSHPPRLLQPFICNRETGLHLGNMQFAMKNVGNASALNVIPYMRVMKIIPEHRTGNPIIDEIPIGDCKVSIAAKGLGFPLAPGKEFFSPMRQAVGAIPPLAEGETVQFHVSSCIYYFDEYGSHHGTCDNYVLLLPSSNPLDILNGSPSFVCDGMPKMGQFGKALTGSCQQ